MSLMNSPFIIFFSAKEFFETGTNYAAKYFKLNLHGDTNQFDSMIHAKLSVPATNISFSLELILKAFILHKEKLKKKGHELEMLFELLDEDIKKKILENYQKHNYFKKYVAVKLVEGKEKHGTKIMVKRKIPNNTSIQNMLKIHSNSFEKFRYIYDFKKEEEWFFDFKEFSNFTLSALIVLAETLNIPVKVVTSQLNTY